MVKIRLPGIDQLETDARELMDVLERESDLATVLISASYLDVAVASVLRKVFCDDQISEKLIESPSAALGGFSARTSLAYAIGLIRPEVRDDLLTIAKIRNKIAHSHLRLGFDESSIRDLVVNLRYLETVFNAPPSVKSSLAENARAKFVLTVGFISSILLLRVRKARRFRVRLKG